MRLKHFLISLFFALAFTTTLNANSTDTTHTTVKTQEQLIQEEQNSYKPKSVGGLLVSFFQTTGLNAIINPKDGVKNGAGVEMSHFAKVGVEL
jgi:oxaloacetate decarboxylase beta subunit